MSVARMRAELSNDEFVRWHIFLKRREQREEMAMKKGR